MSSRNAPLPIWLRRLLIASAVVSFLIVTGLAGMTVRALLARPLNPATGDVDLPDTADADGASVPLPAVTVRESEPVMPDAAAVDPSIDATGSENIERVTVLVMGLDRRPGENVLTRTDSMMLISVAEEDNSVSLLSIPRDLWVDVPDHGFDRINTAFVSGAREGGAEGGARRAMQTVANTLGVTVHHYLLVDFGAVINMIDTLGGVTVDVPYTIDDPLYPDHNYGYDPFYIEAGRHTLNGETALKYMRTRHSDNDFFRARRQQQVMLAARNQVLALGLPQMIARAPTLFQELGGGLYTDMSLQVLIDLGSAGVNVADGGVQQAVLDYDYVTSFRSPGGASVLRLDTEKAASLIAQLFN